ncbi:MAG: phosphoribosylglycinamide formyltransferase [Bacteroidetes bacterium]|nr:phosphoribosylglycinamide formyltransferase [Bacteroidota bacterium]
MKPKIVIFASGSGTNALNLIRHFKANGIAETVAVFCNVPGAGVIEKAEAEDIPVYIFTKESLQSGESLRDRLLDLHAEWVVLAGFLWLIPSWMIRLYPDRIVNIHPALLPAYGGKGMYGDNVHKAVLANGEKTHGVTVHLVNEEYDKGRILAQEHFEISPGDTLETIAAKIHAIEYKIYPACLEKLFAES